MVFTQCHTACRKVPDEVISRYQFSNYLIDPNRRRFNMIIRIVAIVMKFIRLLLERVESKSKVMIRTTNTPTKREVLLSDSEIEHADYYFFQKATQEMKHFHKKDHYSKFSTEVNGILKYTGRILPSDRVEVVGSMTRAMKDLTVTAFCVPVIDGHSPIAYSIVTDYHWNDEVIKHAGIETTCRQILKYVYIHKGPKLVKKIRRSCERCRYLLTKTIDVSMGPISQHNIKIAPPCYVTQVDLAGPFKAYSYINKRATLKIWMTVFCCSTTGTTSIKIMEDYSTPSFIQSLDFLVNSVIRRYY